MGGPGGMPPDFGFGSWTMPKYGGGPQLATPLAGLGALIVAGNTLPYVFSGMQTWSKTTRKRMRDTYLYFGMSAATCAMSAVAFWKFGMVPRGGLSMLGVLGLSTWAIWKIESLPYERNVLSKAMWFLCLAGLEGAMLSGLLWQLALRNMLHLAIQAAALTIADVVAVAAVVAACPSTNFLWLGGPLAAGLGLLLGANLINMIFRTETVMHIGIAYFGVALFSGYLLYDTAKILKEASLPPTQSTLQDSQGRQIQVREFDPIRHALKLYLDALNIFIYILRILMEQEMSDSNSGRNNGHRGSSGRPTGPRTLRTTPLGRSSVNDLL